MVSRLLDESARVYLPGARPGVRRLTSAKRSGGLGRTRDCRHAAHQERGPGLGVRGDERASRIHDVTDTVFLFLEVTRRYIVCRRTTVLVIASEGLGCQCWDEGGGVVGEGTSR